MGFDQLTDAVYFVSGIDTDAGKTFATGWLARELNHCARRTATLKFVQTGSEEGSPDVALHRRIMGCGSLPEDLDGTTAPLVFSHPASPHLAARLEGATPDLDKVDACVATLANRYDTVLVEGAGGLMVPLTETVITIDAVRERRWPVVFVSNGKLGSINHTLLSLEALQLRAMPLAAFVWNHRFDGADKVVSEDAYRYLKGRMTQLWPQVVWLDCPVLDL